MICLTCKDAADQQAPREQHCDDPKCMRGHRVDRYRTVTEAEQPTPPPYVVAGVLQRHLATEVQRLGNAAPLLFNRPAPKED